MPDDQTASSADRREPLASSGEVDLSGLAGRTAIVTGATSGIGAAAARALAGAGARVVLAVRDPSRGTAVAQEIPGETHVARLDLADLGSIAAFADAWTGDVDLLVNNAGIMFAPEGRTADGFEPHIGTNHLGHFALTQRLMEHLTGRVITISSELHRRARLRLDDLNWEHRRYKAGQAYNDSKLANVLFTLELQRRLQESGSRADAVTAHPGLARTGLASDALVQGLVPRLFGQDADQAARSILLAATPRAASGAYVGPAGLLNLRGEPASYDPSATAQDGRLALELWKRSAHLTAS